MRRLALSLAMVLAGPAGAAGPVDPDWPCIQRRQPALSVAQLWPAAVPAGLDDTRTLDPAIQALGQQLALRRTSMEEAAELLARFIATHPDSDRLPLFMVTLDHLQAARGRVLSGITRYAHAQAGLDAAIIEQRHRLERLLAAADPDHDAIDAAEAAVDWSTRIFLDRQQSLIHVCETPVILEQRAFALARLIAGGG